MKIVPLGDSAFLINFEQTISPEINRRVVQLQKQLADEYFPEIEFMIPAYCSLTIGFSNLKTSFSKLKEKINRLENNNPDIQKNKPILHKVPVCYEPPYSIDIQEITKQTNLSKKEIIGLHTSQIFQVYMMGFLPGFAYLGSLPKRLFTKRKEVPRKRVESGAVGLAGLQTGIYPMESPGGWQIIGRTPIDVFDLKKENPFYFKTGDHVQFYPISKKEFEVLSNPDSTAKKSH